MRHQNFLGLDLVELGECAHRLTGAVHEGRWLQQPHAARLGNIAMKLRFLAKRGAKLACERIQPPEAGVVAGPFIFTAGITQANYEFDRSAHHISDAIFPGPSMEAAKRPRGNRRMQSTTASPLVGTNKNARRTATGISNMQRDSKADYFLSFPPLSSFFSSSLTFWFAAGTSAADTAGAATTSSAATARGMMIVATAGSSPRLVTASTPAGSFRFEMWIECPAARSFRSTSMNSGRSFGRQAISSSFRTWETMPLEILTPGAMSALMKCRGTFM